MSYSDQQIRDAVNAVFQAYDKDNSGSLDSTEVGSLINDALKHMGNQQRQVTPAEISQFIKAVDVNNDGKIEKNELYDIFKKVLSGN